MSDERGAFLRVGFLILLGLGLLVGLVLFLGGNRLREGQPFETYFSESVQGLEVGAPVKFRGVTLGRVTSIGLVSATYNTHQPVDVQSSIYRLVLVRFLIDTSRVGRMPNTELAVRSGLRARLASQGITGVSYIELDFVSPNLFPPPKISWTPQSEFIPSMPSTLLQVQDAAQQFLAKLNGIDLNTLVDNLNGLLTDLRGEFAKGDVHTTLQQATELLRTLDQQVEAANLPALSGEVRNAAGALRETVQSREVKAVLTNTAAAAERISAASARLPALIAALEATARRADSGTADVQQALVPLLRDLQATIGNLRETTDLLRQSPGQALLGGPPPREPATGR
jgi:ABC-type transporter Mla subunit MlaD